MIGADVSGSVLVAILEFNQDRKPRLVRFKLKRMASDSFSFFRGTDHLFARQWEDLKPRDVGPELLICGDLHLENFGAYRDDDGEFLFDINDFDEAAVAPCSFDVVRCATSILLAAEIWRLTPLQASGMVLAYLDEYRSTITTPLHMRTVDAAAPRLSRGPIWELLGKTALGNQMMLLDHHTERLKNGTRRIDRNKARHPELKPDRAGEIADAVKAYGASKGNPEFYRPLDITGRIAGIGSLGLERYLVLVAGGGSAETNQLLDIKESRPSSVAGCSSRLPTNGEASDAARVVQAHRTLQARPPAGLDVIKIGETYYRIREMVPEENRSSLDRFQEKPAKLRAAIVAAGRLTGLSQLRGAEAQSDTGTSEMLARWADGSALDSVLAAAARYAERTRLDFKQYRADLRAPDALPEHLRRHIYR